MVCICTLELCSLPSSSDLAALRSRLTPTRTTLLSVAASIFPIELLSTPDLLYTIVAVPLPIPLSAADPGPPLTMASHKDVTEEGVATALGFVAQVVQLMAAYLGEVLVYPITCIGSRSLIKDGISAMVGPRMCVVV
jgi:UV radiation resistance-associated gene protein